MIEIDTIIHGDCLTLMKGIDSDSIDLIVTDPPYGYSFMGKDWDKAVIGVGYWKECLRVLKAGAFAFIMSAPRQDVLSRMIINLQDAGFETGFTSIYWAYASGFPKACNISKMVDKRMGVEREVVGIKQYVSNAGNNDNFIDGVNEHKRDLTLPSTPEAKTLDGSYGGFQPKPAVEVILVIMKPCSEKTYVDQALANEHGVTWLDDGRIHFKSEDDFADGHHNKQLSENTSYKKTCFGSTFGYGLLNSDINKGRFPANLLCSDDVLNDGVDRQSGGIHVKTDCGNSIFGKRHLDKDIVKDNGGSFSRYFSLDSWWDNRIKQLPESVQKTFPFMIVPKASKSEKNKGCEDLPEKQMYKCDGSGNSLECFGSDKREGKEDFGRKPRSNHHPTVKPLKLFSYLITLGSREGDLILDPFVGSGTSCVSAKALSRHYIGIERESEYVVIAEARIAHEQCQPELQLAGG